MFGLPEVEEVVVLLVVNMMIVLLMHLVVVLGVEQLSFVDTVLPKWVHRHQLQ